MAHVLNVVIGTSTVTLGSILVAFTPKSPNDNGDARLADSFTVYASQTIINSLERALGRAREWDRTKTGDAVYLKFQPGSTGTTYRSQIYDGKLAFTRRALDSEWVHQNFETIVAFERDAFWEDDTERTLAVTNTNGTATGGLTVYNAQNAAVTGSDFYATITADAVSGDLASPAKIYYKNTTNDAKGVSSLYIGHYAEGDNFLSLETGIIWNEATGTTAAGSSGGSYKAVTWVTAAETSLSSWSNAWGRLYQHNYKVIARFSETFAYTDLYLKAKLMYGTAVLTETRWQLATANKELQVVGSLRILPYMGKYIAFEDLTLVLYGKRAGGSGSAKLDYLALIPQDGYRKIGAVTGAVYNDTIIDDPYLGVIYNFTAGHYKHATHIVEEGEPIMLVPNTINTLYFLHDTTDGQAEVARTATVQVKYRPRRRTI